jgi:hypothetical protein
MKDLTHIIPHLEPFLLPSKAWNSQKRHFRTVYPHIPVITPETRRNAAGAFLTGAAGHPSDARASGTYPDNPGCLSNPTNNRCFDDESFGIEAKIEVLNCSIDNTYGLVQKLESGIHHGGIGCLRNGEPKERRRMT